MSKVSFIDEDLSEQYIHAWKDLTEELFHLAVIYKTGTVFDEEAIGDSMYGDFEFGMLYPPWPSFSCSLNYISDDIIENDGPFKLVEIRDHYDSKKFLEDLEQNLDHLFIYDEESDVFQEIAFATFDDSFDNTNLMETHSLDLITYEIDI